MVNRATVQRNTETGTDGHGNPLEPVWAAHCILPCLVYNDGKTLTIDGDKTATVEALRIAFPLTINGLNADITQADRITAIKDLKGCTLYDQNYLIKQKTRKYDHYEADLKAVE